MKRWRSVIWLVVSVACFVAAYYFWRLGDKWGAKKPAAPVASTASATNAGVAANPPLLMVSSVVKRSSTAPIVELNPPATNAVAARPTNAFPYRLSNTKQTVGELSHNSHAILLENALIDSSDPSSISIPDSLRAHGDPGAYIVQANGPMNDAFRAELKAAGATIVSYIPNNAYLVRASAAAVQSLGPNATVTPWQPYFKVKASLMQTALDGGGVPAANVAVFTNALAETKAALDKMGITVASESPSPFGTELALRKVTSIADLAGLPGVEEIEPSLARTSANDLTRVIMSDSADVFVPTNYLGLSGLNVMVAVADSWVPTNGATIPNPDLMNFSGPTNIFPQGIADTEGHATHVGGIIASSGLNSPTNAVGSLPGANFRGKAPAATLWALPAQDPLVSDAELQQLTASTNAPISNNSWGYGTSDYNLAAASYDQAVRDSLPGATGSQPVIYVFAAGNNGQGNDGGLGGIADTLLSPAVAKNVISVGASELPRGITNQVFQCDSCNTNTPNPCHTNAPWAGMTDSSNQVARFSSRGNVGIGVEGDFGRFKPDVIAPGTFVVSTRSMTWDTNAYYSTITDDANTFFGQTVKTNRIFNDSVFVPCDAIELDISAVATHPTNIDLPIYASPNGPPLLPSNLIGTNFVTLPPALALNPVDTFWEYGVGNPTNVPVTYNITTDVIRTNELGNYFQVLQGLNDQLVGSNSPTPYYRYESGTSMAAPAVSGTLALMEDYFTNQWKYTPSPALMKALLINGARSINPIYDFQVKSDINYQGWGLVNLTNSLPLGLTNTFGVPAPMLFQDQDPTNALATGDSRTFFVMVNSNAQTAPLRITLVWTDPPGNPAASLKLVNNLDLIVTNLDNPNPTNPIVYFGNDFSVGDLFTSQWDGDTNNIPSDNVNNVENIYIPSFLGTNYSITVVARNVNVNAVTSHTNGVVQDYALVLSSANGEVTNALTLASNPVVGSYSATLTSITNQFPDSPDTSGGLLLNQRVGASSPLEGTNTLGLGNQNDWGTNGQITVGVTNQWHFYVVTNDMGFTNAAFATFLPVNLSLPPIGPTAPDDDMSTRPEADIDLYVARGPTAFGLTNLDPAIIGSTDKSLSRGGTEFIVYSNAQPGEVFYIGVKAEDQEAAQYGFLALFSRFPFSDRGPNGEEYLHGINVPTIIPDGTPEKPGVAMTMALAVQPIEVRRVVVTNIMEHENFGDLFGTLSHAQASVVLNNHTFGNGSTNQEFIYEDNDEGDIPGSVHPDGPGSLQNFIGQQGLGLWMLQEEDNAQFNTGRVDNVFIRIDPQQDTNGVVATIQPGDFFNDFIDVPPAATNLTIRVDFLNGDLGPVVLYVRYGEQPTTNSYDYTQVINAPFGILSINRSDIPPLRPGRYYVGIFNPTTLPQTVRLSWTLTLDPNGALPTPITTTNGPTGLPDDAVTNASIFITNNQKIVTVNVGVVIDHPRISDLDLTLIAPTGQRILLFENRGGDSATNMGHLNITTNFFGSTASGTAVAATNVLSPVPNVGTLIIDYQFYQIPDRIDVLYDGVDIYSNTLSSSNTLIIPYGPGTNASISIVMNLGNNSSPTTQWMYTPRVVSQDFTYLTFTDDTNLTQIPIKFALPPYDNSDSGTNIVLSDFELNTNGEYIASPAATPITIPDPNGGWTMTTNDVFIRTNYFAGTNLLSMATNEVSVATDFGTAAGGSNYLALANGSISRTVSLIPSKDYTINYLYRGPGIAGWWRGEGDATDSGDPETLGNNGGLIGRFNFPAGEVGQAFAMEDSGLAFDFAGTNTYVQVRQSPSLDVGQGSGFTVEGWINPTNINFQQPLVEWLAHVPTNTVVNGLSVTNFVVRAGPFLNRANGHYYYLLGQTNWTTSELWAQALGGHLSEVDDANEQNWIYDTFAQPEGTNFTLWIGLTNNNAFATNFIWSTGNTNVAYTNWDIGQPTNCPTSHFVAILGRTNSLPGLWTVLDNNGLTCTGAPTNKPFGVVEVNEIQTNGVQFWISVTNSTTPGDGRLYANIFDTNGVPHEIFSPAGLIQSNVYQHVALTYSTNSGIASLYYDGTNVTSTNLGVFVPKTGGDVLLGKDMSRVTNNFFWGRMDEMSIYSRFLSPAEIASIYRISASTTNRNIGKFDPSITPAESLAEAEVSFGGTTNLIYGANSGWQVQGFTLKASSNAVPLQITGIEPGILLDSFTLAQKPPGNLYYLPEQPLQALVGSNAFGNWTLEIRDARTGAVSTNAELVSWQLQFILETNISPPIQLNPQSPGTNTVPPGQIAYFTVFVPSWADNATNVLVSATAPVDLLFNQTAPPGTGAPGDFTLLANSTGPNAIGNPVLSTNSPTTSVPPLLRGGTYYLGVRNNGNVPSTVVVQVNFDITTLTNGLPFTSRFNTNELERPFVFNVTTNASEATFQLLKLTGDADLVVRKGLPLPNLLSSDYGSFSGSNADETIYVLTNSLPVPLSAGQWYLDVIKRNASASNIVSYAVLAKELDPPPNVITLTNRVPLRYTAGPGAALTNFFKFSVTNFPSGATTNLGLRFELFNQTGDGDLTVQTNAFPLAPPFLQTSRLPGNNAEIIFIHTNSAFTNLNADWYLGVPSNETNPISFTILAQIDTNGFPAFPTAEGSGAFTRGGALGTNVYHVTSLQDSGAGTLRAAVTHTNGGGTVVFDVSGDINLLSPLYITNSFLTIAGQTAPSNGVTVAGAPTYVQDAHDIILRYLRFRPASATNSAAWSSSFKGGIGNQQYNAPTYFAGGWHVDSGSVDLLTNGPPVAGSVPYDGAYFIDINGGGPGQISTNITTVAGTRYNVKFAYTKNPNAGSPPSASLFANGQVLATVTPNIANSFSALNWQTTSFVYTATSASTLVVFAANTPGASGVFLDDVSFTVAGSDSLQFTNVSNVVADHISSAYGTKDAVSVLNSTNVTVQWSVVAESLNTTNIASGGSEIRYGAGDVTFHHNLYADNYSGNPTIGEDVSLDFVNNVIFNWGIFSGFSTNDLADNPGGLTNFLNYSANYLIAGSNSVFTNVAFWGGTTDTWIFQTNNFIDTNGNGIIDGANTSWGMFSNQFTEFSHPFAIPPTAPDEAFIAYERVLDFAGNSLFKRDLFDRGIVQRARLRTANAITNSFLSGMGAWWPAEGNATDIINNNNGTINGGVTFVVGKVGRAFLYDGTTGFISVSASPSLNVGTGSGMTIECWIKPDHLGPVGNAGLPIIEYDTPTIQGAGLWFEANSILSADIKDTTGADHILQTAPNTIVTNALQHVAITYDKASGQASAYINGVQMANANFGNITPQTTFPLYIGKRVTGGLPGSGDLYNGLLDELSLYNRALSPCEIAAIYNAGSAGKQSLLSGGTNTVTLSNRRFVDVDQDGIPDFWEITLGENPTNFSPNLDRDGDGYTDLEEYMNWLGVPHALTVTNTQTSVNLYQLSGNTGNLLFGVANGTNGTVYLTNDNPCLATSPLDIAVFTPTNNFGNGTNGGFGSFTYMVTNTDTMAYFGPVTVSVFVSSVPITNVPPLTNVITFTNPPDITTNELTLLTVTNTATESITNQNLSYRVSMTIDTNAMILRGWPLTYVSTNPSPVIDANGIITWTPSEEQGPGVYIITTVVTDDSAPPVSATNSFTVIVNEVNLPPVFNDTPPDITDGALITMTVTNAATDPDVPTNTLTYILLVAPAGATIDTNGVITWTPTLAQAPGLYTFTTVVTDTNLYALFNNSLSATNTFTVFVPAVVAPFAFTQPAQAVTGASAQLNGMATPNGLPTMAWFEWGTNTLYGNQTPPVPVGNLFNVVYTKSTISGLQTNVPYHFRLVVSNVVAVITGFDQTLDEAKVVAWGADYVKQVEVPPGLSNVVAVAGAYDHSLALKNNETVVAWGDDTFTQTNVPPGLSGVLAIAGGQYSSIALKNNGTVAAWGGNILSVTNVPTGLNNVVMISGGTYASLALQGAGTVVAWGANFFGVTNVPVGLNNVVEVAGGSYHSLAIRNDGTVLAWGDNSAGQTNVPPSATNVVAIAGGNYHSLALRNDGTVVSWGDNSSGQTNVPPGLSNVVAVAAGGFHSLALKSDGTVVAWGDNTAGQGSVPAGLSNVVTISSGYFHNLALTPTLLSTNPIILNITNGVPQTNSVLSGATVFYRVNVPLDADAATNTLLFTVNGPLNIWYTTNTPPTVTSTNDFLLLTNSTAGTSVVATATSPQLNPGTTYYLGIQNTNSFAISYAVRVDFEFPPPIPLTNGVPTTNSIPNGGLTFYEVDVPTNADYATNLLLSGTGPLNVWFSTNNPPTVTNANDFLLITNVASGSSILGLSGSPLLVPGGTYYLGVQNTNGSTTTYGIEVDFHLTATTTLPPPTNGVPISGIIQTNINGTNGFLLIWFAPTNDLFQVQWTPSLPPVTWNTFTNIVSYHTYISPTNSEFEFFDDGSQTGGFGPMRFYRTKLINAGPPPLTNGVPTTNSIPNGGLTFYQVNVPTNADYATNLLLSGTGPLNVWFSTNNPPTVTNANDFLLITNVASGSSILGLSSSPLLVPGGTYYLGVQNTNGSTTGYGIEVNFHLTTTLPPPTNGVPISGIILTNINGTNGFLLIWFAPTNDLFQVQWTPSLPPVTWNTFTNIVSYHTFISPTNSEFEFFDDGSQTGGLGPMRFYRTKLVNAVPAPPPLTNGVPTTNSIPNGGVTFYQVNVPTNADFATNLLLSGTGPLNVWFSTNNPPTVTNANDFLLITNVPSGSSILGASSSPMLVPGGTYYLGVQNTNGSTTGYGIEVDFHLTTTLPPPTNGVPISGIIQTNINGTNGFLLTWFAPTNALFQVQWTPSFPPTNWNAFTNIVSYHTFISPTNSEFEFFDDGSQTGGLGPMRFYRLKLLNSGPPIPVLTNGVPVNNPIAPGTVTFYQVNVPANADFATNLLLSGTGPLNVWFSTNNPPTVTNANDFLLITNVASGASTLGASSSPLLLGGGTYYLGVQNTNAGSVTYSLKVDFHFVSPSTNPVTISSITATNIGGTNNFLLVWFAPTNDVFQVQWTPVFPPTNSWNTFTNFISYTTFISPTNSRFTFLDDGSQTGGFGPMRFYRLILVNSVSPGIIRLTNGVPLNFTTGPGLTNFFSFDVTETNAAVLFELYNLTGNGDLLAQRSNLPVTLPYFSSTNLGTNYEQIVIRTNGTMPDINAISWFLGVPNQGPSPINYTIRAVVPTNGILISGLPLDAAGSLLGGTNVQLTWGTAVEGEKYEVRTNSNLGSTNWVALTSIVAAGTSVTFTDPLPVNGTPSLFYQIVQVP